MNKLWMKPANEPEHAYIAVYRCRFTLLETKEIRFKYSADEFAQLFLDGQRIQEGPEKGCPERWYYQNCTVKADAGEHVLTARVLCFGFQKWAYSQLSVRHGFYIEEESNLFQDWDCQIESGCSFEPGFPDWGAPPRVHLSKDHNSGILKGEGGKWLPVEYFTDERPLVPPDLPLMKYEKIQPDQFRDGLFYFKEYVCVWADYRFSGKGTVKIRWTETPYLTEEFDDLMLKGKKGKRDGKYFVGNFDTFEIDGDLHWFDYCWRAGHYVQIIPEGNVQIEAKFHRTGYPYPEMEVKTELEKMALSTLLNCSHDTIMDCPYYERLQYILDSRLEALYTYALFDDHRLIRKALRMFSLSQRPDGSLNAQYPSRSLQTIPAYMPLWILMLHDYYVRHGDDDLVQELRPRGEKLLDYLSGQINSDGLLEIPGWNFIDWDPSWNLGAPCGDKTDSTLNLLYVLALQAAAEMKFKNGTPELADKMMQNVRDKFYDHERQLYAMDLEKTIFSEHSQIFALLAANDTSVIPGLREQNLIPCSIGYSGFYLDICKKFGLYDLIEKRLRRWDSLPEEGLTTFPEEFEFPRSDCHAWSCYITRFMNLKKRK